MRGAASPRELPRPRSAPAAKPAPPRAPHLQMRRRGRPNHACTSRSIFHTCQRTGRRVPLSTSWGVYTSDGRVRRYAYWRSVAARESNGSFHPRSPSSPRATPARRRAPRPSVPRRKPARASCDRRAAGASLGRQQLQHGEPAADGLCSPREPTRRPGSPRHGSEWRPSCPPPRRGRIQRQRGRNVPKDHVCVPTTSSARNGGGSQEGD